MADNNCPHGPMYDDTGRLEWLEQMFKNCPQATLTYNDDDSDPDVPVGFTIAVEGCDPVEVTGNDIREALDLARAAFEDTEDVA